MTTPACYYRGAGVTLYCGQAETLLPLVVGPLGAPDLPYVVLTDAPYARWKYVEMTDRTHMLDFDLDREWCTGLQQWVLEWTKPIYSASQTWLFTNVHYVGAYLRWAAFMGLPLAGIYLCPDAGELLTCHGAAPADGSRVRAALEANTYGQGKSVEMLIQLLRQSDEGLVVDPFCGTGATLLAARELGREAVGIEVDEAVCEATAQRLDRGA